jgi:FAD/FMN-containing dehydrogenase
MMRHDLFCHLEMELFVRPDRLHEAVEFIEGVLRLCAGKMPENFGSVSQIVSHHGDTKVLAGLKGTYAHHYPITFRHVLKDDAMISMTSDGDAYAISFITYSRKTESFEAVMSFLASVMASAFGARPHWGKLVPLNADEIEKLYPRLPEFRAYCEAVDPNGVFRNRFVNRKMWAS